MPGTHLLRLSSKEKPRNNDNKKKFQKPSKLKMKKLQSIERKDESVDIASDNLSEKEQEPKLSDCLVVDSRPIRKFRDREQSKSKDNFKFISTSRNFCLNETQSKQPVRHRRMVSLGSRSLQERREQHKRAKSIKEIDLCSNTSREDNIPKIIQLLHSAQVSPRFSLNNTKACHLNLAEYLNKRCL